MCGVSEISALARSEVGRVGGDFKRQLLTKSTCCITPRREEFSKIDHYRKRIATTEQLRFLALEDAIDIGRPRRKLSVSLTP